MLCRWFCHRCLVSEFSKYYGFCLSHFSNRNIYESYVIFTLISRKTLRLLYISVRENKDVFYILYFEETWEFFQFLEEMIGQSFSLQKNYKFFHQLAEVTETY